MKKQLTLLLVFLFGLLFIDQAGNLRVAGKDTFSPSGNTLVSPEEVGMNSRTLTRIDSIAKAAINEKVFPGCEIVVMKDGKAVYNKCFGTYTYESTQKVQATTLYDLASLSKTTGTLLAIMKLYDEGKLKLNDKVSKYLSFLRGTDKESLTIKDFLFHETGLPAGLPFYSLAIEKNSTASQDAMPTNSTAFRFKAGWASKTPSAEFPLQVSDSLYINNRLHDAALQLIAKTPLKEKSYLYSCVNFIVLKELVETVSGMPMDVLLEKEFYSPMGLTHTAYLPLRTHKKEEVAPTLKRDFLRTGVVQGFVHDEDAAFLGNVSGNAGLFASAQDVATIYQMLLNDGELDGKRYLRAETCKLFTSTTSASGRRGLGFDKPVPSNPKISPCCAYAPTAVYGHTGYTGTCCWVDPVNKLVYVFLSNRTYPNDGENKLAKMSIRPKIQAVIYQSLKR